MKVTMSRISTPLDAAAAGTHHTAKKRPASRFFASIAINTPKQMAASDPRSKMVPMAVRMKLTRLYYPTRPPFNKPSACRGKDQCSGAQRRLISRR